MFKYAWPSILLISLAFIAMQQRVFEKKPVVEQACIFEITKGDSLDNISKQLLAQHISIKPIWFKLFAYQSHLAQKLKAGEYDIPANLSSFALLELLSLGKTRKYAITFPEGWAFKQILQAINDNPHLQHTLTGDNLSTLMTNIGSDKTHPEGWFFPDTYFFEKHSTDIELLKRAHSKMQQVLNEEWSKRDQALPLQTPYQALILASIIEKETAASDERQKIAGVFSRRLKMNMLLQTDPTVIYGMGDDYHGDIRYQDLHQTTPYNTYINLGLPPTPIAMPGKLAIFAALHPEQSNSLYFVAKGDGHHVFSDTLAEHNQAVKLYQH